LRSVNVESRRKNSAPPEQSLDSSGAQTTPEFHRSSVLRQRSITLIAPHGSTCPHSPSTSSDVASSSKSSLPALAVERPTPTSPDSAPLSQWKTWTWRQAAACIRPAWITSPSQGIPRGCAQRSEGLHVPRICSIRRCCHSRP
jgi:hypothetical protein